MKIDLQDVRRADNSVSRAIEQICSESCSAASGVIGPSFATSGPGPGWSRNYDASDYAARALADDYGACSYVDSHDGREATLADDGEVVWSDESIVELVVPAEDDALAHPEALAAMVSALRTHSAESDIRAWKKLVESVRAASDALSGLEVE